MVYTAIRSGKAVTLTQRIILIQERFEIDSPPTNGGNLMVEEGKFIVIHYTGTFDDGEVFDTSKDRDPLEFQVGSGMVIPGLDKAVAGMAIGDIKDIHIEADEAYGDYDDTRKQSYPLEDVKQSFDPQIGMNIAVQLDNGHQVPATVSEVTDAEVVIDMNHPLAGKALNFNIELLEINEGPKYSGGCSSCGDSQGCSDAGSGGEGCGGGCC